MNARMRVFEGHRIRIDRINPWIAAIGIACVMFLQGSAISAARTGVDQRSGIVVAVDVAQGGKGVAVLRIIEKPSVAAAWAPLK